MMNADIPAGNAARQWMMVAVSHVVLYCVKTSMSQSAAMLPQV